MKANRSYRKRQSGGSIGDPPITVYDPNDTRLKAYNDSLQLNLLSELQKGIYGQYGKRTWNDLNKKQNVPMPYSKLNEKYKKDINFPTLTDSPSENRTKTFPKVSLQENFNWEKENKVPYVNSQFRSGDKYIKYLSNQFNNPSITFMDRDSPEFYHPTINPEYWYNESKGDKGILNTGINEKVIAGAVNQYYKKPVQPYVLGTKPTASVTPKYIQVGNTTVNNPDGSTASVTPTVETPVIKKKELKEAAPYVKPTPKTPSWEIKLDSTGGYGLYNPGTGLVKSFKTKEEAYEFYNKTYASTTTKALGGNLPMRPQYRKKYQSGGNPYYDFGQAPGFGSTADIANSALTSAPGPLQGLSSTGVSAAGNIAGDLTSSIDTFSNAGKDLADKKANIGLDIAGGLGKGAATGAMIGSVIPGLGTVIGGIAGGIIGGIGGIFKGAGEQKDIKAAKKTRDLANAPAAPLPIGPTNFNIPTTTFGLGGYYNNFLYPWYNPKDNKNKMAKGGKLGNPLVDSLYEANKNVPWVKRIMEGDTTSMQIPGQEGRSTHFMASADNFVYPTVAYDSTGKLTYFGDKAYENAMKTGNYVKMNSANDANTAAANGYKDSKYWEAYAAKGKFINGGSMAINNGQKLYKGTATNPYLLKGKNIIGTEDLAPLTEYTGFDHEDGGIPVGQEAEVEAGETRFGDYIFSNQLTLPGQKKTSFADKSKKIASKYKGREGDNYAAAAKSQELENLSYLNDMERIKEKKKELENQIMASIYGYNPYEGVEPTEYAGGGKLSKSYIKAARKRPGGSNVGKYNMNQTFAGPSGGAPKGSFPIGDLHHAESALKLAHNAPNPSGVKSAVYKKYPQLRKAFGGDLYCHGGKLFDAGGNLLGVISENGDFTRGTPGYDFGSPLMYDKGGKWIQKAVNPAHKGYCTPMTKSTCTPRRKAFAMTMKKHHGFHDLGGPIQYPDGGPFFYSNAPEFLSAGYTGTLPYDTPYPFTIPGATLNQLGTGWDTGYTPSLTTPDFSANLPGATANLNSAITMPAGPGFPAGTSWGMTPRTQGFDPGTKFAGTSVSQPGTYSSPGIISPEEGTADWKTMMPSPWAYAAQGVGSLYDIGLGLFAKDKVDFDRIAYEDYNPELVNYYPAMLAAQRQGALGSAQLKKYTSENASGAGNALARYNTGIATMRGATGATLADIQMQQDYANAGIRNTALTQNKTNRLTADTANAQIQMAEAIARQQEKDAKRTSVSTGLHGISDIFGTYGQDVMGAKTQAQILPWLNQENWKMYFDEKGRLKPGYKFVKTKKTTK